jgi:hypothetical protein
MAYPIVPRRQIVHHRHICQSKARTEVFRSRTPIIRHPVLSSTYSTPWVVFITRQIAFSVAVDRISAWNGKSIPFFLLSTFNHEYQAHQFAAHSGNASTGRISQGMFPRNKPSDPRF